MNFKLILFFTAAILCIPPRDFRNANLDDLDLNREYSTDLQGLDLNLEEGTIDSESEDLNEETDQLREALERARLRLSDILVPYIPATPARQLSGSLPVLLDIEINENEQIETRIRISTDSESEDVTSFQIRVHSIFTNALDHFITEFNEVSEKLPNVQPRPKEKIEALVKDNLICPNIENFVHQQKEEELLDSEKENIDEECLICKLENTKEKLKCCVQPVHAECLSKWWSTQPNTKPLKCLHCQKIINE